MPDILGLLCVEVLTAIVHVMLSCRWSQGEHVESALCLPCQGASQRSAKRSADRECLTSIIPRLGHLLRSPGEPSWSSSAHQLLQQPHCSICSQLSQSVSMIVMVMKIGCSFHSRCMLDRHRLKLDKGVLILLTRVCVTQCPVLAGWVLFWAPALHLHI